MTLLNAIILGLVQGLAEFLPISSSGHLAIVGQIMGIDPESSNLLSFNILLHIATLAAVVIIYRKDIYEMIVAFFGMIKDLFLGKGLNLNSNPYRKLVIMLIVGTIPAVISALIFEDIISDSPLHLVGICLIITSVLLFVSDHIKEGTTNLSNSKIRSSLIVGLFQAVAVLPGISRSGSTIVGGFVSGFSREFAVKFSFLLSIPAILGALVFDIKDILSIGNQLASAGHIIVGMLVAFVSGYFAIKFLLKLVRNSKFVYFSYYCAAAGVISLILSFILN